MKRIVGALLLVSVAFLPVYGLAPGGAGDAGALLLAYLKSCLVQQVPQQAASLAPGGDNDIAGQVKDVAASWSSKRIAQIRAEVTQRFGQNDRAKFEKFVADFAESEGKKDIGFLQLCENSIGLAKPWPADYASLRSAVVKSFLQQDLDDAAKLLGKIQAWVDLRQKHTDMAPLAEWLKPSPAKEAVAQNARASQPAPAKPQKKVDSLAEAEAPLGEMQAPEGEENSNPLDNFSTMRSEKRTKVLEEAQAGMQQVASERQAAEEEYAAKKTAEAQAEADAMKRHADKLAAVDQQALEQRQNSWSSRLKAIVGATISATTGAFTGGVGTRAGQEAANALFR